MEENKFPSNEKQTKEVCLNCRKVLVFPETGARCTGCAIQDEFDRETNQKLITTDEVDQNGNMSNAPYGRIINKKPNLDKLG